MMKIVLATTNPGKIEEIKAILDLPGVIWSSWEDWDGWPTIVEDGSDFKANAAKKAREVSRFTGLPALADDSGLEVAALGGRPGVNSARYAGRGAGDAANVDKLLRELEEAAAVSFGDRSAHFTACVVLAWPDGRSVFATGRCDGSISKAPAGEGGFGYDSVFVPEGSDRTMAELSRDEKNRLSHRGRALARLRPMIEAEAALPRSGGGPPEQR